MAPYLPSAPGGSTPSPYSGACAAGPARLCSARGAGPPPRLLLWLPRARSAHARSCASSPLPTASPLCPFSSPAEGGALYALGLIHTNHGHDVRQLLLDSLRASQQEVRRELGRVWGGVLCVARLRLRALPALRPPSQHASHNPPRRVFHPQVIQHGACLVACPARAPNPTPPSIDPCTAPQVIQHGACLGLGIAALGTEDEEAFEDVKNVLYMDNAGGYCCRLLALSSQPAACLAAPVKNVLPSTPPPRHAPTPALCPCSPRSRPQWRARRRASAWASCTRAAAPTRRPSCWPTRTRRRCADRAGWVGEWEAGGLSASSARARQRGRPDCGRSTPSPIQPPPCPAPAALPRHCSTRRSSVAWRWAWP